jgi:hypothetical protein
MTDEDDQSDPGLPEVVFVPAHPLIERGKQEIGLEIRRSPDGNQLLPAFTTLDRLVGALGSHQPWVRLPLRSARAIVGLAGIRHVAIDPVPADDVVRWTSADIIALTKEQAR